MLSTFRRGSVRLLGTRGIAAVVAVVTANQGFRLVA